MVTADKAEVPSSQFILTMEERVPDFGARPTVANTRDGKWSDPETWSVHHIPKMGDIVRIRSGSTVDYDVSSDVPIETVGIAGTLRFSTSISTRLVIGQLMVYKTGTLEIGTEDEPVERSARVEILFRGEPLDTGTIDDPGSDPAQYGLGLLAWGSVVIHGADVGDSFVRLSRPAAAGDTFLVSDFPLSWRRGDQLLLPDSRQISQGMLERPDDLVRRFPDSKGILVDNHREIATIASNEGGRLRLEGPLRFSHPGASGHPDLLPHVANISRNVIFRSKAPEIDRGHTMFFRGAKVDVTNASFVDLGRTTVDPLDNTEYRSDGTLEKIGKNQIARYPLHLHHAIDPKSVVDRSAQFRLQGNVVQGGPRWGIVVHGSHFGLIENNVVFDVKGAGIVTEDGSETGNRFERNLVASIEGTGLPGDYREDNGIAGDGQGHEGSAYWFASDNNIIRGNVAAGFRDGGFSLFRHKENRDPPAFPGLAASDSSMKFVRGIPVLSEFSGNEAYGTPGDGIELWSDHGCAFCGVERKLQDNLVWNFGTGVHYDYHSEHYAIEDIRLVNSVPIDPDTTGISIDASTAGLIENADIENVGIGVIGGGGRNISFSVSNASIVADTGVRIISYTNWSRKGKVLLRDMKISSPENGDRKGPRYIELSYRSYGMLSHRTIYRPILVRDFQDEMGNDFELFYKYQAPTHAIPKNRDARAGCPEEGLTNRECRDRYGISLGGKIAPCTTTIPGIDGFACSLGGKSE
ncbi:MAG: G8 domain-containing protein [Arenicellales bacterium]